MIPDEVVEQVSAAADIVAIIGEHVRLKKMGGVFRGPCPFHQGTNNNFSVMPKGGYTCFVCGEKGSVFTFVQKRLGLSFVEAVKYVGEKSGIEVKETERKRARLTELADEAAKVASLEDIAEARRQFGIVRREWQSLGGAGVAEPDVALRYSEIDAAYTSKDTALREQPERHYRRGA